MAVEKVLNTFVDATGAGIIAVVDWAASSFMVYVDPTNMEAWVNSPGQEDRAAAALRDAIVAELGDGSDAISVDVARGPIFFDFPPESRSQLVMMSAYPGEGP